MESKEKGFINYKYKPNLYIFVFWRIENSRTKDKEQIFVLCKAKVYYVMTNDYITHTSGMRQLLSKWQDFSL